MSLMNSYSNHKELDQELKGLLVSIFLNEFWQNLKEIDYELKGLLLNIFLNEFKLKS